MLRCSLYGALRVLLRTHTIHRALHSFKGTCGKMSNKLGCATRDKHFHHANEIYSSRNHPPHLKQLIRDKHTNHWSITCQWFGWRRFHCYMIKSETLANNCWWCKQWLRVASWSAIQSLFLFSCYLPCILLLLQDLPLYGSSYCRTRSIPKLRCLSSSVLFHIDCRVSSVESREQPP